MRATPRRWPNNRSTLTCAFVLVTLATLMLGLASAAHAAEFQPGLVISDSNMHDYDSMTAEQVQAFLEKQPGILDTLVTTDHAGVRKRASTIIWEACQYWTISPKVMLTMLQKEQSLLTRTHLAKNTLSRAIGAGCPDGHTNRYPGFGNQMWWGAYCLDGYGEGRNRPGLPMYFKGISYWVYGKKGAHVHPKNLATLKLYVYNPSIGAHKPYGDLSKQACSGNANFWKIYRKHFGNPLSETTLHSEIVPAKSGRGTITPSNRAPIGYGMDSETFAIAPSVGAHIDKVLVDSVSVGPVTSYRFIGVKATHSIKAVFAPDTFTIVPAAGPNGSISPETTQTVSWSKSKTFTIAPQTGYRIADVFKDGVSIGASSTVTFGNVTENHRLTALFTLAY